MTRRNLFLAILLITTTAAISIAAVLLWSRSTSTPQTSLSPVAAPANDSPAVAQLKSHAPGAAKEGIKVHGHWAIDIRNPDGKLVERREFENALTPNGAAYLGQFLQRTTKPGEWSIRLNSSVSTNNSPCNSPEGGQFPCVIFESASQDPRWSMSPHFFKTLTISSQGSGTLLAGTATAQTDGVIGFVTTQLASCPVDTQGVCPASSTNFAGTQLATPINVVAGQIIQVTVVISFS